MKTKIYALLSVIVLVLFLASCAGSAVDSAMSKVEKAVDRVEKNKDKMTKEDWTAFEKEMEEPINTLKAAMESDKIGIMKRAKLMLLLGRLTAVVTEAGLNTSLEEMEKAGIDTEQLQEAVSKEE